MAGLEGGRGHEPCGYHERDGPGTRREPDHGVVGGERSRARAGISEKTERRVRSFLEKRGYVPSRGAVRLRGGARQGVGLFLCGPMYTHLMEAFNRFVVGLADMPGTLEIMMVSRQNILEGVRELVSRGVSSVVWIQTLSSAEEFREPAVLNYLSHTHTVLYNYPFGEGGGRGSDPAGILSGGCESGRGASETGGFSPRDRPSAGGGGSSPQVKCFQEAGLDPVLALGGGISCRYPPGRASVCRRGIKAVPDGTDYGGVLHR